MLFNVIDPACIDQDWPVIAAILAPAVQGDPRQTIEGLHKRLASGADRLLQLSGDADGLMVLEVASDLVCWVKYAAGRIKGGPKRRVRAVRATMHQIENVARAAGCTEIRLCGRDWSALLTDYSPFEGQRNGLRKGL